MKILGLISLGMFIFLASCKQEPVYNIKEPFGEITTSSVEEYEDTTGDFMIIPKKFLNKDKLKERERRNEAIHKKLKEARKFDPSAR